jgi:inner membrane protein
VDTLTHALSGALLARALWRKAPADALRARTLAGGLAAAFPDIDYALFWLAPLDFLSLHRSFTHSLVMLPLWAWLLAHLLGAALRVPWRGLAAPCAAGLAAHIAGDAITIYGTQVFWPLSAQPVAFGLSFDVNPWIAAIVLAGCAAARRAPMPALTGSAAALAALLVLQAALRAEALAVARVEAAAAPAALHALPQPSSPWHWLLIVEQGESYRLAHLDLLGLAPPATLAHDWIGRFVAGYRPRAALTWTRHERWGADAADRPLAREAWPQLAALQRFARLPALYRIDREDGRVCVWFTDLRHVLPALPPAFRYGVCREAPEQPWRPYRLRYFSADARQAL